MVEEFIKSFHSLEGTTLANRKKNFFKLLGKNAPLKDNPQLLDGICANLTPHTYLEKLYQVDFFIYFRRKNEIFQLLKEGNDAVVSKIVKETWFFKDAFNDIAAEQIVYEILPCLSFSVRMKILRKLSRYLNCDKFDQVFDLLSVHYGIFTASKFITGCTPNKIRVLLIEHKFVLNSTQLRITHGKDRDLISVYFTNIKQNSDERFLRYLLKNDPSLFEDLKLTLKLGRRNTKKVVASKRDEILKNPYRFNFLNMRAVLRKLGKDSQILFINALPPQIELCLGRDWLFRSFASRYRYSLHVKTLQEHYRTKFEDHSELISQDLLRIIPDNKERALLAKVKVDEGCDEFLQFLEIDDAMRLIKEKINLTSDIHKRKQLILSLITTCKINKNEDAFVDVLKYYCNRHKNEDLNTLREFVYNIYTVFNFGKFTAEMWNIFNDFCTIYILKFTNPDKETLENMLQAPALGVCFPYSSDHKFYYLEFLFKNNQPIDGFLKDFYPNGIFPSFGNFDKKFEKHCLLWSITEAQPKQHQEIFEHKFNLWAKIYKFNEVYKDETITFSDFPELLKNFDYVVKNANMSHFVYNYQFCLISYVRKQICTLQESEFKTNYTETFWQRLDVYGGASSIEWFMKNDPLALVFHSDAVFNDLIKCQSYESVPIKIWSKIKKFTHLGLDKKFIEASIAKIKQETTDNKLSAIRCLAILMKPSDFAAFADSFKPIDKKIGANKSEMLLYDLRKQLANNFLFTKSYEVLPTLLNFCIGDYFPYALRSLYGLMYRTPSNLLPQYLIHLSKQAVSVRKHALFLTCELSPLKEVKQIVESLNKQEKVASLQKRLFLSSIKYFVKNSSEDFFELVKVNMLLINKADTESLNCITNSVATIPEKFKALYVQHAWDFIDKTIDVWQLQSSLKSKLLKFMNVEMVNDFPLEFALKLIEQHFLTEKRLDINRVLFNFATSKEIFEQIFTVLDASPEPEVLSFLENWFHLTMSSSNAKIFAPFFKYYETKISTTRHFKHYVKTRFLKLKIEDEGALAVNILCIYEEILEHCGPYIVTLFAKEMASNLKYFCKANEFYDLYLAMLIHQPTVSTAVLILNVMLPPKNEEKETFEKILELIKGIDDDGVKILLNTNFNQQIE